MRQIISILGAAILMTSALAAATVETGLDVLLSDQLALLRGKSVAIVCNHTALTRDGQHIIDCLGAAEDVTVRALFGPEHGIRGTENAGAIVGQSVEERLNIPIYSLYDQTRAPQPEELEGVDVIVFDIQDVGARFYTYISTMGHVMEAAAANGIPIIILDRPNPISGLHAEGPICEPSQFTFVGRYPIPVRHALTVGELAQMIVGEGWIDGADQVDLTVIPCRGWDRSMYFDETDLEFPRPSPNIPSVDGAIAYPGTCFFEGTNLSEGRGTDEPFLIAGAPFMDGDEWAAALNAMDLPGVHFVGLKFTPMPNAGSSHPKWEGEECGGVYLEITERDAFRPVRTGFAMIASAASMWPDDFEIGRRASHFDRLWGTDSVRLGLFGEQQEEAAETAQTAEPTREYGFFQDADDATPGGVALPPEWASIPNDWTIPEQHFWERAQQYLIYD